MNTKQDKTISTSKCAHPEAMVSAAWVAELYENGLGVTQDYSKAHKWFEKAADDGNTDAMIRLGRLYEQGLGVAQDYGKALEWFQKALG
jgi:TPR repeat protein